MTSDSASEQDRERVTDVDRRLAELACDLHDGLLQYVIAARMVNESVRHKLTSASVPVPSEVDTVEAYLQQAISEGRRLIETLQSADHPSQDPRDLATALRTLVEHLATEGQVRFDLQLDDEVALAASEREVLFRVAQEAISNIRRHSCATTVDVRLQRQGQGVLFEIMDNGRGFDVHDVTQGHFGLVSMRQRVEALGGELQIDSQLNRGTRILVRLPTATAA